MLLDLGEFELLEGSSSELLQTLGMNRNDQDEGSQLNTCGIHYFALHATSLSSALHGFLITGPISGELSPASATPRAVRRPRSAFQAARSCSGFLPAQCCKIPATWRPSLGWVPWLILDAWRVRRGMLRTSPFYFFHLRRLRRQGSWFKVNCDLFSTNRGR